MVGFALLSNHGNVKLLLGSIQEVNEKGVDHWALRSFLLILCGLLSNVFSMLKMVEEWELDNATAKLEDTKDFPSTVPILDKLCL